MPRPKTHRDWSGLLVVDKPVGPSSMMVVRRIRRAGGMIRTGHAGTLDPLASGVVLCCVGQATRQIDRLMGLTKVYEAEIDLSAFTDTDDREGPRQEVAVDQPPDRERVREACASFVGRIQQVPPAFSAIHVRGERSYDLARRGDAAALKPRTVQIDAIEFLELDWPRLAIRVTTGKGVYIRSLARDLGRALGTGGHLASLRRTAVGPYHVDQALPLSRFDQPIGPDDVQPLP